MSEQPSLSGQIGRAGAVIMIWSMADKILAIGKEVLTAHRFGVSASLDVFNLAYSFPGTIVLFSGVLGAAFVPLYLEWRNRSSEAADSHATWFIYVTTLIFTGLALICFVFAPEIIRLIGYGFQPWEKQLAVTMERLLILLIIVDGAGILLRGLLHARKNFSHLYVAPLFVNITIIFLLYFDMGLDIYVLVWGFLIGTLMKTVYMGIALYRKGFQYGTPLPFDRQKMKAFWLLAIPMLGNALIANSNVMIDQVMATQLPAGSISTLRYAFRINDFPIQVVITAVSMAIFPFISEESAAGNKENLRGIFKYAIIFLGFLTIPITCLVVLFSEDIVILLLKRGAFDMEAARQTAQTLVCYSLGLFFYGYTFVNGSFFAALQNTKALFYMGIASIFLNVFFNFVLMHLIGVKGIALSSSITMFIISIYFVYLLKRRLGISNLSEIFSSFYRMILAAACMLGTGFLFLRLFQMVTTERWIYLPITITLVCISYLGVLWMFRTEDLTACWDTLTRMLRTLVMSKKTDRARKGVS
jgi:putative peptidoglycan lipid II flippase